MAKRGGSLIETLVACLILAILAIAGATAIYQTEAGISVQKSRLLALGIANSRLEEIRATSYGALTNVISQDYNTHSIRKSGGQFVAGSGETVSIGGNSMPITTTIQYVDADGGLGSYDYLRVTASVQYRSANEMVTNQTAVGP